MRVSLDRAGRIVVPKPLRDQLGLEPGTALEIEVVSGRLELSPRETPPPVVEGPHGPVIAATGTSIGDAEVRRALEAARERR